jgi:hypothetical protein
VLDLIYNSAEERVLNIWSKETLERKCEPKITWIDVFGSSSCLAPFGFLYDTKAEKLVSIFDLLREVPKDSLKVSVTENNLYTIHGESDRYRINLAVFPDKEFVIGGYLVEVRQIVPDILKFMEYSASNFERIDGFFFPRNFSFIKKSDRSPQPVRPGEISNNGQATLKERVSCSTSKVLNASINKHLTDKNFSFQTKKLNGTRVLVKEVPQIEYIWVDGKIEPKTNELMLRIAQGDHKFIPGTDEPRFWFMLIGFLFLAAGCGLQGIKLYKKWHDDKKPKDKKEDKKE